MDQPTYEIPSSLGIKAELGKDGSVMLEQYDPYSDDRPNIIVIEAYQVGIVAGWLQQCQKTIEAA